MKHLNQNQRETFKGIVYFYYQDENGKEYSVDLGSDFEYKFNPQKKILFVNRNIHFIPFFYNKNNSTIIQNFSLLLGANGSGKTSIIKEFLKLFSRTYIAGKNTSFCLIEKEGQNIQVYLSSQNNLESIEVDNCYLEKHIDNSWILNDITFNLKVIDTNVDGHIVKKFNIPVLLDDLSKNYNVIYMSNVFDDFSKSYSTNDSRILDISTNGIVYKLLKKLEGVKKNDISSPFSSKIDDTEIDGTEIDGTEIDDFALFSLTSLEKDPVKLKELYDDYFLEYTEYQSLCRVYNIDDILLDDRENRLDVFKIFKQHDQKMQLDFISSQFYSEFFGFDKIVTIEFDKNFLLHEFEKIKASLDNKNFFELSIFKLISRDFNGFNNWNEASPEISLLTFFIIIQIKSCFNRGEKPNKKELRTFLHRYKTIHDGVFSEKKNIESDKKWFLDVLKNKNIVDFIEFYMNNLCEISSTEYGIFSIKNIDVFNEFYAKLEAINKQYSLNFYTLSYDGLSSGQLALLNIFSKIYSVIIDDRVVLKNNILLIFDEIDLYLHPQWQKQIISRFIEFCNAVFHDKKVQIIMTTNNAIPVSDVLKYNVVLLGQDQKQHFNNYRNTFGGNIFNLLNDTFFIQGGFIGEFAQMKIQELIDMLYEKDTIYLVEHMDEIEKRINLIGEDLIKNKLLEILEQRLKANLLSIKSNLNQFEERLSKLEKRNNKDL